MCAEDRTPEKPCPQLLEGAASEHNPSPVSPSPHLKFQNNEHFAQKGKFSALTQWDHYFFVYRTHPLIPRWMSDGSITNRGHVRSAGSAAAAQSTAGLTHPVFPWSLLGAQGHATRLFLTAGSTWDVKDTERSENLRFFSQQLQCRNCKGVLPSPPALLGSAGGPAGPRLY